MDFREFFDINPDIIYLNSGTLAICPRAVKQSMRITRDEYEKNPAQSLFDTWAKMWTVQQDLAKFLNADPQDLWLRTNVTVAMNDFIMGVELPEKSEILISDLEYGAITNICKYRAEKSQLSLRTFHLPGKPEEFKNISEESLVETVAKALGPKTSLLMLSHVTTGSGLKLPIDKIAKICHEKNIIFAVDGAHAPGAMKIDFSNMNCDFYGSNLHKWMMGPKGTGFGWVNKRVKDKLHLSHAGWTTYEIPIPFRGFANQDPWSAKWMISSSHDFTPFFAIQSIIKFWDAVGENEILKRQKQLGRFMIESFQQNLNWKCLSDLPDNLSGPLYAFQLPAHLEKMNFELMNLLRTEYHLQIGVANIQGTWHLRMAPQCYNTEDEITKAIKILKKVI